MTTFKENKPASFLFLPCYCYYFTIQERVILCFLIALLCPLLIFFGVHFSLRFLNVPKFWKHLEECCIITVLFVWSLVSYKKLMWTIWQCRFLFTVGTFVPVRVVMLYKTVFVQREFAFYFISYPVPSEKRWNLITDMQSWIIILL